MKPSSLKKAFQRTKIKGDVNNDRRKKQLDGSSPNTLLTISII
jgi:hypothetical protein